MYVEPPFLEECVCVGLLKRGSPKKMRKLREMGSVGNHFAREASQWNVQLGFFFHPPQIDVPSAFASTGRGFYPVMWL